MLASRRHRSAAISVRAACVAASSTWLPAPPPLLFLLSFFPNLLFRFVLFCFLLISFFCSSRVSFRFVLSSLHPGSVLNSHLVHSAWPCSSVNFLLVFFRISLFRFVLICFLHVSFFCSIYFCFASSCFTATHLLPLCSSHACLASPSPHQQFPRLVKPALYPLNLD